MHRAVLDAQAVGVVTHALAIDPSAKAWLPSMFGQGRASVVVRPEDLVTTLAKVTTGALPLMKTRTLEDPPGGVLLWLIVGLELVTFAMVFGLMAHQRAASPQAFAEGQGALSVSMGLTLTLVLLTSGALAAKAVHAFREGQRAAARRWFHAAAAVGVGFVVLKLVDSADHLRAGFRLRKPQKGKKLST